MNVSYQWLRTLTPGLEASPEEVAERLAMRGAPVEGVRHLGADLDDILVAEVLEVRPHPNADRLTLCTVEGGSGPVQVVCGAPNVRSGTFYPYAPVGAVLPGGHRIRKARIRGEESFGMLCSERELGLGRSHEGIMEIRADIRVGAPLVASLGLDDVRLDVEVTTNRPDLLSHLGVAREVAPEGERSLALPPIPGRDSEAGKLAFERDETTVASGDFRLKIEAAELCSRYLGLVIRGVKVGPSPEWLAARLRAVGSRPINNVVDATNWILHELGQPLHAFDLAKLAGPEVVVRTAAEGEKIRTLDGVERVLSNDMLAICDAERPVAVAGVMGGAESEVSGETVDILLECALFEPRSIRSTRKALGLSTDSSYRFERGVDPAGMERALARAAEIVAETAGGTAEPVALDACPRPWTGLSIDLRMARIERILGIPFTTLEVRDILEPLGFEVEGEGDTLTVEVPGFRSYDVRREIDLIEEVARCHGYDRFPEELGPFRPGTVEDDTRFQAEDRLRDLLVGRGFFELQTPAFAPEDEGEVEVSNPVSVEESRLRTSLLPGLVRRVEHNFGRGLRDVRLFEIGTTFRARGKGELPEETTRLGVIMTGGRAPIHWTGEPESVDLWDLKGLFEEVLALLDTRSDAHAVRAPEGEGDPALDPGTAFVAVQETEEIRDGEDGRSFGRGGALRREVIDAPAWAAQVWAFEIELSLLDQGLPTPVFRSLPTHPGIERDLALILAHDRLAGDVIGLLREEGGEFLQEVEVFDVYRGEKVPSGTRSVAFRLLFRAPDRTLTDDEIDERIDHLTRKVKEAFGAELRGG